MLPLRNPWRAIWKPFSLFSWSSSAIFSLGEVPWSKDRLLWTRVASVQPQGEYKQSSITHALSGEAGSIPTGGTAQRLVHSTGAACQAHLPISVGWRSGVGVMGCLLDLGISVVNGDGV